MWGVRWMEKNIWIRTTRYALKRIEWLLFCYNSCKSTWMLDGSCLYRIYDEKSLFERPSCRYTHTLLRMMFGSATPHDTHEWVVPHCLVVHGKRTKARKRINGSRAAFACRLTATVSCYPEAISPHASFFFSGREWANEWLLRHRDSCTMAPLARAGVNHEARCRGGVALPRRLVIVTFG
jgi:hypothetical protein